MASAPKQQTKLQQLEDENKRLRAENKRLKQDAINDIPAQRNVGRLFRALGSILFVALAVALLVAGNLLFWAGNTVVKPDRFETTITPIIKDKAVQSALAARATNALFESVDVQQYVGEALPERAEFLAPTIASSLKSTTQSTLKSVLARPQFQDRFNAILTGAQERFINQVKQNGADGAIDIQEVYEQLSTSLQGTQLSFLAGRKLPAKVGSVQLLEGRNIEVANKVVNNIDAWRVWAIILFVICAGLSIFLSRNRRRGVIRLGLISAIALFVTLVALRVIRENVADHAQYADAARNVMQTIFHPLVAQTTTIIAALLVVTAVAWLTGTARSAAFVRSRFQLLFAGKLHGALFGPRENGFTRWVGVHKQLLEWVVVGVLGVLLLVTRLTIKALVTYVIVGFVLVLLIEVLGAPVEQPSTRKTV